MSFNVIESRYDLPQETDLIIALGKNLGVEWDQERVLKTPHLLSQDSEITTIAAGELYLHDKMDGELYIPARLVLVSGGKTLGPNKPSQSAAAKKFMLERYPDIPPRHILVDEDGFDTAASAEKMRDVQISRFYKHIGLLSVGYHVVNSAILFENYGVSIESAICSENIYAEKNKENAEEIEHWRSQGRIKRETKREGVRGVAVRTIDKKGRLLRRLTSKRLEEVHSDEILV